ncbi:hypothetical protein ABPG72_005322 [Tetrahymena utriculariae]
MRVYPRLEGPQNIPSFNKIVKCSSHGKMCTMVCMMNKCDDRTLCADCILDHTHSHLSKIIPLKEFNEQTSVIPQLIQREILQVRSQVFSLQNQLVTAKETRKKEFRSVIASIKDIFTQEIETIEKEGITFLEKFFNKHTEDIGQYLYIIQGHLSSLAPYLSDSALSVQSSQINHLLNYQDTLLSQVLPQLETKTRALSKEIIETDIFLNNQTYINRVQRELSKSLNIRLLFTKEDPIKAVRQSVNLESITKSKSMILNPRISADNLISSLSQGPVVHIPKDKIQADIHSDELFKDKDIMKVFSNHFDVVNCVCIIDNSKFCSAGGDKSIRVWDIDSGYQLANMHGHQKDVWALQRISSIIIASASADKTIRMWNIDSIQCVQVLNGHTDVIKCLCYCSDKQILVSGAIDNVLKFWDLQVQMDLKNTINIHSGMIRSLCYIEVKGLVISASSDNLIKATSIDTYKVLKTLSGHYGEVNNVIYLYEKNQDSFIASAGVDKNIYIWNVDKAQQVKQFKGHYDSINTLTYSKKYEALISGSTDKLILVWDKNGKVKNRIKVHSALVSGLAYLERRNLLISAGWDNLVYVQYFKLFEDNEFA